MSVDNLRYCRDGFVCTVMWAACLCYRAFICIAVPGGRESRHRLVELPLDRSR